MYIPNKPSKYGIKIVMICDVKTKYMFDAEPYLGKDTRTNGLPLAEYFVKSLTKSIHGSNRNVTMDNWFTSLLTSSELLQSPYKLTVVGTMRTNKGEIPPELLNTKNRKIGMSLFCFDGKKTPVIYKRKSNTVVILLSTTHEQPTIDKTSKRSIIQRKVLLIHSIKCVTTCHARRWPPCVFYGMLNMILVNAYVLYCHNTISKNEKPKTRKILWNHGWLNGFKF